MDLCQRVVARYLFAKTALSLAKPLERAAKDAANGDWGDKDKAIREVLKALDVRESAGEIGIRRSIEADWFYALGPRQRNRAVEIIRTCVRLLGWVKTPEVAERMAPQVQDLAREVAWVEKLIQDPDAAFQHGSFKVNPMPGVSRRQVAEALEALDAADRLIRPKFPQLLYGKVFVSPSVAKGVASYVFEDDIIYLSTKTRKTVGDVHAICHELGHRFEHRFWRDTKQRDAFRRLSTETEYESIEFDAKLREQMADEFLALSLARMKGQSLTQSPLLLQWLNHRMHEDFRTLRDLSQRLLQGEDVERDLRAAIKGPKDVTLRTDKVVRDPVAVTPYGRKNWQENFCEAFALYVSGSQLPPSVTTILDEL